MRRAIIHVDMDAFFASVEVRDNPSLRNLPVAVCGDSDRSVVAAASYPARKFGIHSAMPLIEAKRRCKDLRVVPGRHDVYRSVSREVFEIFSDFTPQIEPLSIDEAFLDVTVNKKNIDLAADIATEIRARIKDETGLTASAGVSINKFLAKVASDINKPNGQKTIHPSQVDSFIDQLPVGKFFGVGKVTAKKMNEMGIFNGADLRKYQKEELVDRFGKTGKHYYKIVRSIQDSPVNPNRIRKSVGAERTFSKDINSEGFMLDELKTIADELETRMIRSKNRGRTVTVKLKYTDFTTQTRSKTVEEYLSKKEEFFPIIEELIYQKKIEKSVRLLGIAISSLYMDEPEPKEEYNLQLRFDF